MKIIVDNETNITRYLFNNDIILEVTENGIIVGDPVEYMIGDMNSSNSTIYENIIDIPEDYCVSKYKYDGSSWYLNEDYEEVPEPDDQLMPE